MYQSMFKIAQDIAMQKQSSGQISPDDTICVVCAAGSKKIYVGMNYPQVQNGMMVNIHAEIDAIQKMREGGDTVAEFLLLIKTIGCQPILPCNGCIHFIIAQAPENAYCNVVLPDRMIPITQIGQPAGAPMGMSMSMPYGGAAPMGNPMGGSMPYNGAAPAGNPMGGSMPYNGAAPAGNPMGGSMPYGQAAPYGQAGAPSGSMPYNSAAPAGSVYQGSSATSSQYGNGGYYFSGKNRKKSSSKLKNRAANLLNAGSDIGADEKPESELMSKLFKK